MSVQYEFAANKKQTTLFINIGWFSLKKILKIAEQGGDQ